MATLDVRPEVTPGDGYDTSLKFWERRASGTPPGKNPLFSVFNEFDVPHRYLTTYTTFTDSVVRITVSASQQYSAGLRYMLTVKKTPKSRTVCSADFKYKHGREGPMCCALLYTQHRHFMMSD